MSILSKVIYTFNAAATAAAAKSLQSCPTLWDPIDSGPPGSSIPGIPQARTLEWVAISFSNACMLSPVMSDSVQPHRQRPTRFLHPWNFPGKNTGVGCHFLLQCMHAKSLQSCPTLCNPMDSSPPASSVYRILQARILEWDTFDAIPIKIPMPFSTEIEKK